MALHVSYGGETDSQGEAPRGDRPFTVAISTLDRPEILAETLSALRDVDLDLVAEVLIIDQSDSPFDPAPWDSDLPIRLVPQAAKGLGTSRNEVIRQAKTDYILFIDDDVVPDPALVREHWRTYQEDSRVVGVAGYEDIPLRSPRLYVRSCIRSVLTRALRPYLRRSARYRPFLDERGFPVGLVMGCGLLLCQFDRAYPCRVLTPRGCNMSFRRSDLLGVGGFDETWDGPRRDETDLSLRLLAANPGSEIRFNPSARVQHWMRPTGGCRNGDPSQKRRRDVRCEVRFARRHLGLTGRLCIGLRLLVTRSPWWVRDPSLLNQIAAIVFRDPPKAHADGLEAAGA